MFFREPGSKLLLLLSFLIGGEGGKGVDLESIVRI